MSTPLLMTKLYRPSPRVNRVARPRLLEQLDEGLHHGRRLTLLSAPAGFGKTTLAAEWVVRAGGDVAWLSVDEEDDDPKVFFTYLIAALRRARDDVGQAAEALLGASRQPPVESVVTLLLNDLIDPTRPLILLLDDLHLVQAPPVYDALAFLLDHQPPHVHLVLVTRHDPPLPLARLRARSQVTEVRERDLRFTVDEASAFLHDTMGLSLPPAAIEALEARTEGWITGLQLAAVALQEDAGAAGPGSFAARFTGDDRYVVDYLIAEVLDRQPPALRDFLRQTAILDRLTASLCDAVVKLKDWTLEGSRPLPGMRSRPQSQAFLEHLDQANLFVVPLDNRRHWYRYHRLFAEFLRTTLDGEEEKALHRRAMRWYEEENLPGRAIHHALAYAALAADWSDAERLVRAAAEESIQKGELPTVGSWLDALPEASIRGDGALATYRAWLLALNGDLPAAAGYARAAGTHLDRARAPAADRGRLLTLRSVLAVFADGDYEAALRLAADALALLDDAHAYWRVMALWAMAESQERTRDVTEAIATLREARRTGRLLSGQLFLAPAELFLATALHLHGERREAVAVCQEAIDWYTDAAGRVSPIAGMLFSRLGMLHHEAGDLEAAWHCLERGIALSEQLAMGSPMMYSLGFAAPTLYALGRAGEAIDALHRAHQHGLQNGLADADWCLAVEAGLRLSMGDVPWVERWADTAGLSLDEEPQYLRMDQYLVYAHLLLHQGRLAEARSWLDRLESFAHARGLIRWQLTIHILQALAASSQGDPVAARDALVHAVRLAAPEDYVRAFLDEDGALLALLSLVHSEAPAFVDRLLGAPAASPPPPTAPPTPSATHPAAQPLVEPLSARELEVLALVAAGLSNREIANRLFIAVGTVKRHMNNIYGKLHAARRTEAVARAREMGLLSPGHQEPGRAGRH